MPGHGHCENDFCQLCARAHAIREDRGNTNALYGGVYPNVGSIYLLLNVPQETHLPAARYTSATLIRIPILCLNGSEAFNIFNDVGPYEDALK